MPTPFRSFQPVITLLCRKRKDETWKQYGRRFQRMQTAFGRVLEMRMRIEEANKKS